MKDKAIIIGIGISFLICVALAPFASSCPDGLEWVAEKFGFLKSSSSYFAHSLIPDYLFPWIHSEKIATALAGFFGSLVVFLLCLFLFRLLFFGQKSHRNL